MSLEINDVVDKWMVDRLEPKFVETGKPIDFSIEMMSITVDVIGRVAFDYSMDFDEKMQLKENLEKSSMEFFKKSRLNPIRTIPVLGRLLFSGVRDAMNFASTNRKMGRKMLEAYRSKPSCKKNTNTIIDMICNDNQYENDEERISDMLLYFAAGFDTTAHSLSWALLELAKNETEQNKLRNALLEEYSSRRPESSSSSSSFSDPSVVVEVAKSCPELKRVVREILRLHPAAPVGSLRQVGNSHVTYNVDEDDEGDGVDSENNKKKTKKMYIPKNSWVLDPHFVFQRDELVYGQNSNEFFPDRWINPTEQQLRNLLPFSSGMRNCQGQSLANTELHVVLSKIISKYKLSVVNEGNGEYNVIWKLAGSAITVERV